jgi:hypothetical protein
MVNLCFIVDARNHSVIGVFIVFISNQVLSVDLFLSMTHVSKSLHPLLHIHLPVQILLVLLFLQLAQLFYFSLNLRVALLLSHSLLRVLVTLIHTLHLLMVVLVLHLTANLFIVVQPDLHLLILHIVGGGVHSHLGLYFFLALLLQLGEDLVTRWTADLLLVLLVETVLVFVHLFKELALVVITPTDMAGGQANWN